MMRIQAMPTVAIFFLIFSRVFADPVLETNLDDTGAAALLPIYLNTIVMHNDSEPLTNGFIPRNVVVVKGVGEILKMRLYTVYINTNRYPLSGRFLQRAELYSPDGNKMLYSREDLIRFETFEAKFYSPQRAFLDQLILFPELDPAKSKNFGFYHLKIYLNGIYIREYIVPVITWPESGG